MTIGVAIVGLGTIGFGYMGENQECNPIQSHTFATLKNKTCRLILGVDPDPIKRSGFEKTTQVASRKSLTELDLATLNEIDAFIVAVPTSQHISILREIASLKKDFWILCEKPAGLSYEDLLSLETVMDPRKMIINYSRRFSSDLQSCRPYFESLITQSNCSLRVNFHGGLIRTGSHFIDLANFWFWSGNKLNFAEMISKTKDGCLITYPNARVEFVSTNPNSEESFADFFAESNHVRISLIRDVFTKVTPNGVVSKNVKVSQEDVIRALVELVLSDGAINPCSYFDALKVHDAMSYMKKFNIQ